MNMAKKTATKTAGEKIEPKWNTSSVGGAWLWEPPAGANYTDETLPECIPNDGWKYITNIGGLVPKTDYEKVYQYLSTLGEAKTGMVVTIAAAPSREKHAGWAVYRVIGSPTWVKHSRNLGKGEIIRAMNQDTKKWNYGRVSSGFGCKPSAIGSKIYVNNVSDDYTKTLNGESDKKETFWRGQIQHLDVLPTPYVEA